MAHHVRVCDDCDRLVEGEDLDQFCDAFVDHHRRDHPDQGFPEVVLRNFAAATQRLAEPRPRRAIVGRASISPVMPNHLDDWLGFFDHTAYSGNPLDAACYCTGPHLLRPGQSGGMLPWRQNRQAMADMLRSGRTYGYLAFAEGQVAGWINASFRSVCTQPPEVDTDGLTRSKIISLSCITIAPEFRGNGIARALIDVALDEASSRDAAWVEAYPSTERHTDDRLNFRGRRQTPRLSRKPIFIRAPTEGKPTPPTTGASRN